MLINDFVTDITMSAVEVGNEELLIEYLKILILINILMRISKIITN